MLPFLAAALLTQGPPSWPSGMSYHGANLVLSPDGGYLLWQSDCRRGSVAQGRWRRVDGGWTLEAPKGDTLIWPVGFSLPSPTGDGGMSPSGVENWVTAETAESVLLSPTPDGSLDVQGRAARQGPMQPADNWLQGVRQFGQTWKRGWDCAECTSDGHLTGWGRCHGPDIPPGTGALIHERYASLGVDSQHVLVNETCGKCELDPWRARLARGAKDCGHAKWKNPTEGVISPEAQCALASARRGERFSVAFAYPGIDSHVAGGLVRLEDGGLLKLGYDSDGSGSLSPCRAVVVARTCTGPAHLDDFGAVTCDATGPMTTLCSEQAQRTVCVEPWTEPAELICVDVADGNPPQEWECIARRIPDAGASGACFDPGRHVWSVSSCRVVPLGPNRAPLEKGLRTCQ